MQTIFSISKMNEPIENQKNTSNASLELLGVYPDDTNDNNIFEQNNSISLNLKSKKRTCKKNEKIEYSLKDYLENKIDLHSFQLSSLKKYAKTHKIKITAKKGIIIHRIQEHFLKMKHAIQIQKCFRGYLVRLSFFLRGSHFKDRTACVNRTDGYTLEPIDEIPFQRFFTLVDSKNYVYGFDIVYLWMEYRNKYAMNNIFSREPISIHDINRIMQLENLIRILFPSCIEKEEYEKLSRTQWNITQEYSNRNSNLEQNTRVNHHIRFDDISSNSIVDDIRNVGSQIRTNEISHTIVNSILVDIENQNTIRAYPQQPTHSTSYHREQIPDTRDLYFKIIEIRHKSIPQRIEDLFIEIDLLGNYTTSQWFLTIDNYIRFYRHLYNVWNNRLHLTREEKHKICVFGDPFSYPYYIIGNIDNTSHQEAKMKCLCIMENMVYGGIDIESRKIGVYRVLMALTIVNRNARTTYQWLYDAVA